MANIKSLYNIHRPHVSVYNPNNKLIGSTTSYKSIAHNGKSIGSIELDIGEESIWISGYGVFIEGFGIKWMFEGNEKCSS